MFMTLRNWTRLGKHSGVKQASNCFLRCSQCDTCMHSQAEKHEHAGNAAEDTEDHAGRQDGVTHPREPH